MEFCYAMDWDMTTKDDRELRELLSTCFTGPNDHVFKIRRWFREPAQHRFLLRDAQGVIKANIAVHDKTIGTEEGDLRVTGIAEVAVHPQLRGQGVARSLLERVHSWALLHPFDVSLLFGKSEIYAGSGYRPCGNRFRCVGRNGLPWEGELDSCRWRPLKKQSWPKGLIDLRGPTF
jgi:predicted N-acetyltransferase YhbS